MQTQQNQQDVFRQQWVLWQPRIYAYIRTIVFNRSDAEDLLQEVAEVLWRKIDQFEQGTRFDRWAFSVARNKVLGFQKRKVRERVKFSDAFEEVLADEVAAAFGKEGELLELLESCVEKLAGDYRALLRQRYEPEVTNRSIAHELGCSESTISRTLNKVYGLLLSCIEANEKTRLSTRNSQ